MISRLSVVASLAAILFVLLGWWVTHHPPSRIDVESAAVRGSNEPLAILLTNSGYGVALVYLSLGSILVAAVIRMPVSLPLLVVGSQLVSQAVVNGIKSIFTRARPEGWIYRHEMGFSFPSGHATTAIVFYGAWLVIAWTSPLALSARIAICGVLAVWILGIGWSRIALGAHYPTDVMGGYLFGTAWLCVAIALLQMRGAGLVTRHT